MNSLAEYVRQHGILKGYAGAEDIPNAELLELKCSILAPCAALIEGINRVAQGKLLRGLFP